MKLIGYYNDVVPDEGAPLVATIAVYLQGTSTLATIYTTPAGTVVKGNPFATDALGRFQFFAAVGQYDIEVSGTGITNYKIENVYLDLPYSWLDLVCDGGDVITDDGEVVFDSSF